MSDRPTAPAPNARFRRTAGGVYVAATAVVAGDVVVGPGASIWFGAVVRGDVARVAIGANTNVQDNAVIHCDSGVPNDVGANVTVGHGAIVHGVSVGDGTLIGMGATVLGGVRLGRECLVAAGAVVPPGLDVPDRSVVMGVPGKVARPIRDKELDYLRWLSGHYVELAARHAAGDFPDPLGP